MTLNHNVKIGVIGGSGLYELDTLKFVEDLEITTPWGKPSSKIHICEHQGCKIAFISRHGKGHRLNPSEVPHRANISALKSLGVEIILAFSAVGSLRHEIKPLDFVLPDQAIDRTKHRDHTFFEKGCVAHVEFADPFCEELRDLVYSHRNVMVNEGGSVPEMHVNKTLVVMEGPAFSTRAESHLYRSWGCDIINMSTLPEAKLAREAEISYQVVCMATDYDCWHEEEDDVTVEAVIANLHKNGANAKRLLMSVLPDLEKGLKGIGKGSIKKNNIKNAIITAPDSRESKQVEALRFMFPTL